MTNPNHAPLAWANIRLEGILWKLFQLFDDLNGVAADLAPPSGLAQHQGLLGCTFQLHSITLYQISLTFCAEPFFSPLESPAFKRYKNSRVGKQISQLRHSGVEMEGLHDLIFAWENRFWSLKREDLARPRRPHGLGDANATCDLAYSHVDRETSNYICLLSEYWKYHIMHIYVHCRSITYNHKFNSYFLDFRIKHDHQMTA